MDNTKKFKTDQENFWAGDFGKQYIERNKSEELHASNLNFFSKALRATIGIKSCLEFGANIGLNLKALKLLIPGIDLNGIEINPTASETLEKFIGKDKTFHGSVFDFVSDQQFDLTLIKTVLIHINPDMINQVYNKLYNSSRKYILIAEYYNPSLVQVNYRGHQERLFKRDFAGDMLDTFPDLKLVDYGFAYHRDNLFPQDDITWFLLEKQAFVQSKI